MYSTLDVVFGLTGDVRRNTRALRQLGALSASGYRVKVLSLGSALETFREAPGFDVEYLPQPAAQGPRFFHQIHRLFRETARRLPARVYHASDLYTLPAMYHAARHHGGKLVYDARELYPHVASTAGRPWVSRFWRVVEGRYIRHAEAVFTVSGRIADRLADTYGIDRPDVLYNAPPFQHIPRTQALRERTGVPSDTVVVLHQGQMRKDRGCDLLVDAMQDVRGAVLVFLGYGPYRPALEKQVASRGLEARVRFLEAVPPHALLPLTASADVGVTLLEDTCLNHRFALPNKLFEYLMAGVPVLASDLPELRDVVTGFDVGCVVDPSDRAALVATLQHMVDDQAARNHWITQTPLVFETFGWEKASQAFKHRYEQLLDTETPTRAAED